MNNIYNIRSEEKLFFTLPKNYMFDPLILKEKNIAIFINLFYQEYCEKYFSLLKRITDVDIFIISSQEIILKEAKRQGFKAIRKENRGRDLSALLVSARPYIGNYEYICFLHDKKAHSGADSSLIDSWIYNLVENSIGSKEYISNIIYIFEKNKKIGLLAPPEPVDKKWTIYGQDFWQVDYTNTKKLCELFNLSCDIQYKYPPITIGTVFWSRTDALKKLFMKRWDYSDFPTEPLPTGGTINHALERSFGFFAQDAGYKVGTVMTSSYAAICLDFYTSCFANIMNYLQMQGINSYCQFEKKMEDSRVKFMKIIEGSSFYIFGAGKVAVSFLQTLLKMSICPKGFVVTKKNNNPESISGFPVIELNHIPDKNIIIIATGQKYYNEIKENLLKNKFQQIYYWKDFVN